MRVPGSPPHAWGILSTQYPLPSDTSGSPPHAWGILHRSGTRGRGRAVHPHTRGEYASPLRAPTRSIGSPPHAWGIRPGRTKRPKGIRFTPTRVGNTRCVCGSVRSITVHPHTRGEYAPGVTVRGFEIRFTPTRVGNTPRRRAPSSGGVRFTPTRVGNTVRLPFCDGVPSGSPPHAWGILSTFSVRFVYQRFTPTRVGNTHVGGDTVSHDPVHPHTRGEYSSHAHMSHYRYGSPPHAWGILLMRATLTVAMTVHPHTRGEYVGRPVGHIHRDRFTPTRVGNTPRQGR